MLGEALQRELLAQLAGAVLVGEHALLPIGLLMPPDQKAVPNPVDLALQVT